MRYALPLIGPLAILLGATLAHAVTITYEGNYDPNDTTAWFDDYAPVGGDLGEDYVSLSILGGLKHSASGDVTVLTDGTGGTSPTVAGQNFFFDNELPAGKVVMSLDGSYGISKVASYSWQDHTNDGRYPQVYRLYGSNQATYGGTADAPDFATTYNLAGADWQHLARIDSRTVYPFADGADTGAPDSHPQQTVAVITGDGGAELGTFQHLLWRLEPTTDDTAADEHTFFREFDVFETPTNINYFAADNPEASINWFPGDAVPVAGDLAESANVTLLEATKHAQSGPLSNLTNGTGGNGVVGSSGTTFFTEEKDLSKILFSWDSVQGIAEVNTFTWQDFDGNDQRFPQVYELFGSLVESPGTDDTSLYDTLGDWELLATVDSTDVYPYIGGSSSDPSPEQLAVLIDKEGGLGSFRHLLMRVTRADSTGQSPFWAEIDIIAIPEPSTLLLLAVALIGLAATRRR